MEQQGITAADIAIEWDVNLPPFPDNILQEMSEHLGAPIEQNSGIHLSLRIAKNSYQAQKLLGDSTVRKAQRNRFKKTSKACDRFLAALDEMISSDLDLLVNPPSNVELYEEQQLQSTLKKLAPLYKAEAERQLPRAREKNVLLQQTCGILQHVYQKYSGNQTSHSSWKDSVYEGTPQSGFGLFVTAFFKCADKGLDPKQLVEPLKEIIWPSRKG